MREKSTLLGSPRGGKGVSNLEKPKNLNLYLLVGSGGKKARVGCRDGPGIKGERR